jgi:hypothetical protein
MHPVVLIAASPVADAHISHFSAFHWWHLESDLTVNVIFLSFIVL